MIAYNKNWLQNLLIREQAEEALDKECITPEEKENIFSAYTVGFYSPNPFVRIGLFILTTVIALFTLGLFLLVFLSSSETQLGIILIFFGAIAYAGLEMMVSKKHCKSGVDDALLWIAPVCIISGLNFMASISLLTNYIIVFAFALVLFIRFTNMLVAAVAAIALMAVIFFAFIRLGEFAKATAPFVIMLVAGWLYFFAGKLEKKTANQLYSNGLLMISLVALISFCIACNYFAVRETSIAMFNLQLPEGQTIPFGWLFWMLTFAVPLLYISVGIKNKDAILLRTGLMLIALAVFTVRYYYHLMTIEIAAVIAGTVLIGIAWVLIKYLQEPKYGFTYKKGKDRLLMDKLQIESLIIAETFAAPVQPADTGMQFGGGSGGGAGSSGEY